MPDAPTCLNCRWAEWADDFIGFCKAPIETTIPKAYVLQVLSKYEPHGDCPTWEAK